MNRNDGNVKKDMEDLLPEYRTAEPKDEQVERNISSVCAHGSLRRACPICERDEVIATLLESLAAERDQLKEKLEAKWSDELTAAMKITKQVAAERDQLKDALDMATQGKYSTLMLELADGRAEQIHAGIQVCTLRGDIESLTAERDQLKEEIHGYLITIGNQGMVNKELTAERDRAVEALQRIEKWELPATGKFWDDDPTRPMSYGAAYGSNGERDYVRGVARIALAASLQPARE